MCVLRACESEYLYLCLCAHMLLDRMCLIPEYLSHCFVCSVRVSGVPNQAPFCQGLCCHLVTTEQPCTFHQGSGWLANTNHPTAPVTSCPVIQQEPWKQMSCKWQRGLIEFKAPIGRCCGVWSAESWRFISPGDLSDNLPDLASVGARWDSTDHDHTIRAALCLSSM